MSNDDDFSKAPLTIGELKSSKTKDSASWTPRDLLINLLRDIDSGKVSITRMTVIYSESAEDGTPLAPCWAAAGCKNGAETLGLGVMGILDMWKERYEK